jgi:hypothetical protein
MSAAKKITIKKEDASKVLFLAHVMAGMFFEAKGRMKAFNEANANDWYSQASGMIRHEFPKEWAAMQRVMRAVEIAEGKVKP